MPNTPDFELVYFNLDGRGMQIRLLFDLTETPFSDRRISRAEWTKFKGSTPWGFLPVLHQRFQRAVVSLRHAAAHIVHQRFQFGEEHLQTAVRGAAAGGEDGKERGQVVSFQGR